MWKKLCALAVLSCSSICYAEIDNVWIGSGFWSKHFQQDRGFRENNYGLGVQLGIQPELAFNAGVFRNSDDAHTRYIGALWQPYTWGYIKLGLWAGALDGYPKMRNGDWFLAAFPMASIEYKRVGLNLTVMPTYQDKLHGAVIAQFKVKVW